MTQSGNSAFKGKEALFKQVVDRYQSGHLGFLNEAPWTNT